MSITGCAKPKPVSTQELSTIVDKDTADIANLTEPLNGPLTLYEAMARSTLYNLDHRIKMMEVALAQGQLKLAHYDMLPTLAASAGYIKRSNENGVSSISVLTQQESLEPSISQQRIRQTADLGFSWSLLDFGVSYYQAKQRADQYLISQETRKKLLLKLLHDTRTAFWKAAAAQRVKPALARQRHTVYSALKKLEQSQKEGLRSPLTVLQTRKDLLELLTQLEALDEKLTQAEFELKNMINVPQSQKIVLKIPRYLPRLPRIKSSIENMEKLALVNSSDIAEQIYAERIEKAETNKELLRLLPGIEINNKRNYDSNKYLVNNQWNEVSVRVTWNLLKLISLQDNLKVSKTREDLIKMKRLALNTAVISRLHLALHNYASSLHQFRRAAALDNIEKEIASLSEKHAQIQSGSKLDVTRDYTSALKSKLRVYESYASAQEAYGSIISSLGINPVPEDYRNLETEELAEHFQDQLNDFAENAQNPDKMFAYAQSILVNKLIPAAGETDSQKAVELKKKADETRMQRAAMAKKAAEEARLKAQAAKAKADKATIKRLAKQKEAEKLKQKRLAAKQKAEAIKAKRAAQKQAAAIAKEKSKKAKMAAKTKAEKATISVKGKPAVEKVVRSKTAKEQAIEKAKKDAAIARQKSKKAARRAKKPTSKPTKKKVAVTPNKATAIKISNVKPIKAKNKKPAIPVIKVIEAPKASESSMKESASDNGSSHNWPSKKR